MRLLLGLIVMSLISTSAISAEVENISENIRQMGFGRYYGELKRNKDHSPVKIAVFDYGFDGYQEEKGQTIPQNTIFKQRPGDGNSRDASDKNTHGLVMAQILTQYMTNDYNNWQFAPQIYLYKSDGYSNFAWAIEDAIKNGIDIVLHSIVIEYGSNYDGKGFYNNLVNQATNAGILWVNAAGNFGQTTYNSKVNLSENNWVKFDNLENNALPVKCDISKSQNRSQNKKCKLRLVLAWDDFKNQPLIGSHKDLDLYLYDSNFESTLSSTMTQIDYNDKKSGDAGTTLYPREIIETYIPEGTSYVKVRAKSDNFSTSDRMRITADGNYISFPVRDESETLLNPADNPNVITVGEDTSKSSISRSLNKPELIAPSLVRGGDGQRYRGSSNAAAVVAAGIGLMKKINPNLDREGILDLASNQSQQDIQNYPTPQNRPYHNRQIIPAGPYTPGYVPQELNRMRFTQSQSQPEEDYQDNGNYPAPQNRRAQGQMVSSNPYAVPLNVLQFGPLSQAGCFPLADIKQVDPCTVADFIIKSRSLLVNTTGGLKIATSFDPIILLPNEARLNLNDVIAIAPIEGYPFMRLPRGAPLPPGAIEIFKVPLSEAVCKLPDWNFLMSEMDISRRRIYEANATGSYNQYIPQTCRVDVLAQTTYPSSDWSMYPILQHSPYVAPIGPAPVGVGSPNPVMYNNGGYNNYNQPQQPGYQPQERGQNFYLPNPSQVRGNN